MINSSLSKWEQAISKLIEYTQDGKLDWQVIHPKDYLPKEDTTGAMLLIKYSDTLLLLYRKSYVRYVESRPFSIIPGPEKEIREYRAELSIYDNNSKVIIYSFPSSGLIEDLYKAATFYAAKVDDLITNILNDVS